MKGDKRSINLNKIVFYGSCIVLVIGLLIAVQGFGERMSLEMQARNLPAGYGWSALGDWQMEQASKTFIIGVVLSLVSSVIVYLTYTNKLDVEAVIKKNKKKIEKKVSKKLKQILEEESD